MSREWHLATDSHEVAITELEFAVMRVASTFDRWQSDCLSCCEKQTFSGADVATLHVIRMHDRPKSISEIGKLLRRDDIANLQYGVRKLLKSGLIEKSPGESKSRKDTSYRVSKRGREVTDAYTDYRQELLLSMTESLGSNTKLEEVARILNLLSGLYDQASRVAATHRV